MRASNSLKRRLRVEEIRKAWVFAKRSLSSAKDGDGKASEKSRMPRARNKLISPLSEFMEEHAAISAQQSREKARDLDSLFGTSTLDTRTSLSPNEGPFFEIFKVPDSPPPRSETAYDLEAFTAYSDLLETIIEEDEKFLRRHTSKPIPDHLAQPIIDALRAEEQLVPIDLPVFSESLETGIIEACRDAVDGQVALQRKRFMEI